MFERFTDRARRVVVLAQEEARKLNHNYIGTEHLLLGLLGEGEGIAAKTLTSGTIGITIERVREWIEEEIGQGDKIPSGHIPFTPRAKKCLELALREALQLGHNYIGTEHVLLGVVREGEGVASQIVAAAGIALSDVRREVIRQLQAYHAEQKADKDPTPTIQVPGNRKYTVSLSLNTDKYVEFEAPNDSIARLVAEGIRSQLNEYGTTPKELESNEDSREWIIVALKAD